MSNGEEWMRHLGRKSVLLLGRHVKGPGDKLTANLI
jgi:hypothetical protein